MPAIHPRQIVNDGEPQPGAGSLLIGADTSTEHGISLVGRKPLAVVIDRDNELVMLAACLYLDA